jgi:hypothetical protein
MASNFLGEGIGYYYKGEANSMHIVPQIAEYLRNHLGLYFQQDSAPGHAANFTKEVLESFGIRPIWWPPNSPDLSRIEGISDEQKDWVQDLDSMSILTISGYGGQLELHGTKYQMK